jgi:hypothetical protein
MAGKVRAEVEVWNIVQRFIRVDGGRKGRGWGEGAEQGRQRRRRGKAKDNEIDEDGGDFEEDIVDVGPSKSNITPDEPQLNAAEPGQIVQVVHKIDSFESNASKYILFSVIGFAFTCCFFSWLLMTLTFNVTVQLPFLCFPSLRWPQHHSQHQLSIISILGSPYSILSL